MKLRATLTIALAAMLIATGLSTSHASLVFNFDLGTGNDANTKTLPVDINGTFFPGGTTNAGTVPSANGTGANSNQPNPDGTPGTIGFFISNTLDGSGGGGAFQYGTDGFAQDYRFLNDNNATNATLLDGSTSRAASRFTVFSNSGGLDANRSYDLYLVGSGDGTGQGAGFLLKQDGGTFLSSTHSGSALFDANAPAFTAGVNLTVFSDVSPTINGAFTEFELNFVVPEGQTSNFAAFNGVQLVLNPIPEPASLGLLGISLLAMLATRHRR